MRDASAVFSWFEFRYCSLLGIVFRMFGRGEVCLGVGWERPAELWSERWRFKILRLLVHSRNGTIMTLSGDDAECSGFFVGFRARAGF